MDKTSKPTLCTPADETSSTRYKLTNQIERKQMRMADFRRYTAKEMADVERLRKEIEENQKQLPIAELRGYTVKHMAENEREARNREYNKMVEKNNRLYIMHHLTEILQRRERQDTETEVTEAIAAANAAVAATTYMETEQFQHAVPQVDNSLMEQAERDVYQQIFIETN